MKKYKIKLQRASSFNLKNRRIVKGNFSLTIFCLKGNCDELNRKVIFRTVQGREDIEGEIVNDENKRFKRHPICIKKIREHNLDMVRLSLPAITMLAQATEFTIESIQIKGKS